MREKLFSDISMLRNLNFYYHLGAVKIILVFFLLENLRQSSEEYTSVRLFFP